MSLFSKIKLTCATIVTLFASMVALPQSASAAEDFSHFLSISPPDQYITLRPGEQYHTSIRVSNQAAAQNDLVFSVSATPFSVTGGDGADGDYVQNFEKNTGDYNQIVNWISFDKTTGTVAPNNVSEVGITIDVPADAPAGGQYAGIAVTDQTDVSGNNGQNIAINSQRRAVMIIYASVAGQTKQTGSVLEDKVNSFYLSSPISATALFENTGNVHADAKCVLKVYSLFSNEELYSNEDSETNTHLVMPNTRRLVATTWDDEKAPIIGLFRVEQVITYLGKTTTTTQTVLVCPIWLILAVTFIIIFWIVWLILRSKKKKASKKEKVDISEPQE